MQMNNLNVNEYELGKDINLGESNGLVCHAKRTSENKLEFRYIKKSDDSCVLSGIIRKDDSMTLTFIDQNFWTINVNGQPAEPGSSPSGNLQVNIINQSINFTT